MYFYADGSNIIPESRLAYYLQKKEYNLYQDLFNKFLCSVTDNGLNY